MPTPDLVRALPGLGSVRGGLEGEVIAFRGIPYAAPPTGPLRFAPPQAPSPWSGTRDATTNGPIAPQPPLRIDGVMGPIAAPQDEGCLTLTIWVPVALSRPAPVIVWIHGGGFLSGAGSLAWYDGGALAARHGVIVVGVNYRLGVLGFLSIPGHVPGNLGLLDQIEALRWVQRHIAGFGGDPEQVTVAGQSGGAHNIVSMLASSSTVGLFRGAILQSPPLGIGLMTLAEAAERSARFLEPLGLEARRPTLLAALRALPVPRVLAAQLQAMRALGGVHRGDLRPPFVPVEGAPHEVASDELVERAAANAAARGVSVLIGWVRDEGSLYVATSPTLAAMREAELAAAARVMAGASATDVLAAARAGRPGATPAQVFSALVTEAIFAAPSRTLARAVARAGGRAFVYRFDWQSPSAALGACHCLEIPFALGTWRAWKAEPMLAGADEARLARLSDEMMRRWAALATDGDPGYAPVSSALPTLVFDDACRVIDGAT